MSSPHPVDPPLPNEADRVRAAVLGVEGVSGLHAGALGEVATYLPGRRVDGVRLRGDGCEVHVVLDWGSSLVATADRVRDAVRPLVAGPVDVTVEDVAPPAAFVPAPTA